MVQCKPSVFGCQSQADTNNPELFLILLEFVLFTCVLFVCLQWWVQPRASCRLGKALSIAFDIDNVEQCSNELSPTNGQHQVPVGLCTNMEVTIIDLTYSSDKQIAMCLFVGVASPKYRLASCSPNPFLSYHHKIYTFFILLLFLKVTDYTLANELCLTR